ncbi:MAG: hypothetical protein IJ695_06910 [Butyrivibrio sp.]|nr:hypothetical protein [Butyrivibrio sp.]
MKKISLVVTAALIVGAMAGCSSESTSTSEFTFTTTTDEGTTEYKKTTENINGDVTTTETVRELPAEEVTEEVVEEEPVDEEIDDKISYEVRDGLLNVQAISRDDYFWEVYQFENSTKLVDWATEDDMYYASVEANIYNGKGFVIMANYDDPNGTPLQFAVIPCTIKENEIVSVQDGEYVDDLDNYFPLFDYAFYAEDDNGNGIILAAFYRSYEKDYVFLADKKNHAYADYEAHEVTITDINGKEVVGTQIISGDLEVYYYYENGQLYIFDNNGTYKGTELSEEEVNAYRADIGA